MNISFSTSGNNGKKKTGLRTSKALEKPVLGFADDSDGSQSDSGDEKVVPTKKSSRRIPKTSANDTNKELLAYSLKVKAKTEKIEAELDPSVYSYDAVYDSMKSREREYEKIKEQQSNSKEPLYMAHIMAAKEMREAENLEAVQLRLQRERELEGDTFKDKESFQTSSYKKYLKDVEDLKLAETEKRSNGSSNEKSLQVRLFEENEARHELSVNNLSVGNELERQNISSVDNDAAKPNENFVLTSGLNIRKAAKSEDVHSSRLVVRSHNEAHTPQSPQKNITYIKEQIKEAEKLKQTSDLSKLEHSVKRKIDESKILSAKERYLARKRLKQS